MVAACREPFLCWISLKVETIFHACELLAAAKYLDVCEEVINFLGGLTAATNLRADPEILAISSQDCNRRIAFSVERNVI